MQRTILHNCAEKDEVEKVKNLIKSGHNVNARDCRGFTPLHLGAQSGTKDVVETLITAGAELNVQDMNGKTPLHLSVKRGDKDIVLLLIKAGAKTNVQDKCRRTVLHTCLRSKYGDPENILRILLGSEASVNIKDKHGRTPLHVSAYRGQFNIVGLLLQKGCNIEAEDNDGNSPLSLALKNDHTEIVKMLERAIIYQHGYQRTRQELRRHFRKALCNDPAAETTEFRTVGGRDIQSADCEDTASLDGNGKWCEKAFHSAGPATDLMVLRGTEIFTTTAECVSSVQDRRALVRDSIPPRAQTLLPNIDVKPPLTATTPLPIPATPTTLPNIAVAPLLTESVSLSPRTPKGFHGTGATAFSQEEFVRSTDLVEKEGTTLWCDSGVSNVEKRNSIHCSFSKFKNYQSRVHDFDANRRLTSSLARGAVPATSSSASTSPSASLLPASPSSPLSSERNKKSILSVERAAHIQTAEIGASATTYEEDLERLSLIAPSNEQTSTIRSTNIADLDSTLFVHTNPGASQTPTCPARQTKAAPSYTFARPSLLIGRQRKQYRRATPRMMLGGVRLTSRRRVFLSSRGTIAPPQSSAFSTISHKPTPTTSLLPKTTASSSMTGPMQNTSTIGACDDRAVQRPNSVIIIYKECGCNHQHGASNNLQKTTSAQEETTNPSLSAQRDFTSSMSAHREPTTSCVSAQSDSTSSMSIQRDSTTSSISVQSDSAISSASPQRESTASSISANSEAAEKIVAGIQELVRAGQLITPETSGSSSGFLDAAVPENSPIALNVINMNLNTTKVEVIKPENCVVNGNMYGCHRANQEDAEDGSVQSVDSDNDESNTYT